MSSGWTRALQAGTPVSGGPSSSATAAADEDDSTLFFGQAASHAESQQVTQWLQQLAANTGDAAEMEAQQALMDHLRAGVESPVAGTVTRTLASFAHALDQASSTVLLEAQYAQVLDAIAYDLCDILLPAWWAEWQRACRATRIGNALQADDQLAVDFRPVTSAALSLIQHLMEQVARQAAPREVALSLMAFFEAHIQIEEEEEDEFDEGDDEEEEEQKVSARKSTGGPSNAISPFHRLSLAFPLLDLLGQLLARLHGGAPAGATSATSAAAASSKSALLTSRQIELYEQLLSVTNQTLRHVMSRVALVEEHPGAERDAWAEMHRKLVVQCIQLLQPALGPAPAPAASSPAPPSSSSSSAARTPHTLRAAILSFLYAQLLRTYDTYASTAGDVQRLLEGNRAGPAETAPEGAPQASLLTPSVASTLTILLQLSNAVSLCAVTPPELHAYFTTKRRLETAIEAAEMASWAAEGDDADDDDDNGNAHDDEYDSDDSAENAAVSQAAAAEQRKPQSLLAELRKRERAMPNYSIHGVGCYVVTALAFQYFHRIKPERKAIAAAASAGPSTSAASATPAAATGAAVVDPALASFLAPYSSLGSSFVSSLVSLPSGAALSSLGPWIASLLFHGVQTARLDFLLRAIGGMTALWAMLEPASAQIPAEEGEEEHVEESGAWTLSEALLQTCFLCPAPWSAMRPNLVHAWKGLLATLKPMSRVRLLQLSLSACSVASIQALILGQLKMDLLAGYNSPAGTEERAVLDDRMEVLAQLHANLTQAEMDLVGSIDFVLAMVNVFTLLVLREKANQTAEAEAEAKRDGGEREEGRSWPNLGLGQKAVQQVWREKWQEVATAAEEQMQARNEEILRDAARVVVADDAPPAGEEATPTTLLRNQLQLAIELTRRLLEHMQA